MKFKPYVGPLALLPAFEPMEFSNLSGLLAIIEPAKNVTEFWRFSTERSYLMDTHIDYVYVETFGGREWEVIGYIEDATLEDLKALGLPNDIKGVKSNAKLVRESSVVPGTTRVH